MPLPSFNLPGKNIGADKQMSMMRTYLAQLKDETEAELYNIRWDNLSKDLREKIEALDYDIQTNTEYVEGVNQNVGTLRADVVSANYVTTAELSAKVINAGFIKSDYIIAEGGILTNVMKSAMTETGYLTASAILASQVFADKVKATEIDGSKITSGTIAAARISSLLLRTNELSSSIADLEYVEAKYYQWDSNVKLKTDTLFQVPKGDGSGTKINITVGTFLSHMGY